MAGTTDLVTYLVLAPEFGGTRFGPFEGLEIRLGSDPDRCHIVLPASLGTGSEHAKLIRQGPLNLILSPSERTATVFLYKQGDRRPIQLNTPTAVRPGDSFAMVTPDGPRFIIEVGELPPEMAAARQRRGPKTGRDRLNAEAFKEEGKRQVWTSLLVTGPGQLFQRAYTFVSSGAIFQPRNVIMMVTIASGWAFGGAMGCRSGGFKRKLAASTTRVESCERDLEYAKGFEGDVTERNFHELAKGITRSTRLAVALEEDRPLQMKVIEQIKKIRNQDDYDWVQTGDGREATIFRRWRERVEASSEGGKLDNDTAALLVWAGAQRSSSDFVKVTDSASEDRCGRGPLALTYRQALRLNVTASPDGYYVGPATDAEESSERAVAVISKTLSQIPPSETLSIPAPDDISDTVVRSINSREQCVFQDASDDRDRPARLVRALEKTLDPDGALLPDPGKPWGSVSRIAKLYAADVRTIDYTDRRDPGISFKDNHVSSTLSEYGAEGEWVMERTAEAIAKAIILPCAAALNGEGKEKVKATIGENNFPGAIECLVLDYKIDNEY